MTGKAKLVDALAVDAQVPVGARDLYITQELIADYSHQWHTNLLPKPIMSTSKPTEDEFTHQLAIKLSRALNIVNPNDLLARRVQDIARNNSLDGFVSGVYAPVLLHGIGKHSYSYISSCSVFWQV